MVDILNVRFESLADISCPKCGHPLSIEIEDYPELISYYAEDGPHGVECDRCDYTFEVKEHVRRWWTVEVQIELSRGEQG